MYNLLRPRIWPSFLASSGVPSTSLRTGSPATYRSGTPRNQSPAVARWHAHLRGLTTAIHEISGLTGPVSLCCPLSFRPAQNRSYDALWIRLFFVGLRTTIRFELLHAATSLNSFLEALPQVVTRAAVFLWLDDAVLISGHTVFRNAKARRPAIRHVFHSKGRESADQAKLNQKPF